MSSDPCQKPDCIFICSKESSFPDWRKVSLVVPVFKNAGKRSGFNNHHKIVVHDYTNMSTFWLM